MLLLSLKIVHWWFTMSTYWEIHGILTRVLDI